MAAVCNCTDLNRITRIVDGLVKEAAEERAHLANQWWVIVLAYTFVILPWGLLYNVDFISEKWRTVSRTRFLGYVHMLFSIAPMPFIVFYAHLQKSSQDYKEMMTAVIAILMSLYHVVRTGWGLIQLASFSKWCSVLLQRMWRMRLITNDYFGGMEEIEEARGFQGFTEYVLHVLQFHKKNWNNYCSNPPRADSMENDIESNTTDIVQEEHDPENCDRLVNIGSKVLRVNNTVIDNELGGTDLTVKVRAWNVCMEKLRSRFRANNVADDESVATEMAAIAKSGMTSGLLSIEQKELCAVRWSGSFLSSFGEYWSGPFDHDELMRRCGTSLFYLQYVTFPVNGKKTRFPTPDWKAGGPYGSSIDLPDLHHAIRQLNHHKRELENVMGGYPNQNQFTLDRRPSIVLVTALLYAQCIDEEILDSLIDYESELAVPWSENGWQLLLWQNRELPNDRRSLLMDGSLPPFPWGKLLVPLWHMGTNWRVLQASVHTDNRVDVDTEDNTEEDEGLPSCWFEHTRSKWGEKQVYSPIYYAGTILETVRSFLAHWIRCRSEYSLNPEWCPMLTIRKFQFSVNQDIFFGRDGRNLWRWECQSELQESIAGMNLNEVNLPSTIEMILLFILGLPGVIQYELSSAAPVSQRREVSEDNSSGTDVAEGVLLCCLEFIPRLSPQDIKVGIEISEGEGNELKNVSIELIAGESVKEFRWEDWINSAMGYIKEADDTLTSEERDSGTVPWRKRTPRKVNLNMPLVTIYPTHEDLPDIRGEFQVWTGWPFFDIKIVQFEMNEWLRASGFLNGYHEMVKPDDYFFQIEVANAEKGLMMISEWPDAKWETIVLQNRNEMEDLSENVYGSIRH